MDWRLATVHVPTVPAWFTSLVQFLYLIFLNAMSLCLQATTLHLCCHQMAVSRAHAELMLLRMRLFQLSNALHVRQENITMMLVSGVKSDAHFAQKTRMGLKGG